MNRVAILTAGIALFALQPLPAADQWPQFRGLQAGVAADDPTLPDTWSETDNIAWKTSIPGLGWSSPVVWDNHIFLTAAISSGTEKPPVPGLYDDQGGHRSTAEHRWMLYDVDFTTGKIRWERELRRGVPSYPKHLKNSFASETPVTDGELVYVYFGSVGLIAALDMNGRTVWTKELPLFGTNRNGAEYGSAASPVLHKNRLYIVNDNLTQSFIAAFDARTGAEIWRTSREEAGNWSTPYVWENDLRTEIVVEGAVKIRSYGLDGKLLWEIKGTPLTSPTPFAKLGLLFLNAGYPANIPRPVYAIRPGATGDISLKADQTTNDYIAWYQPLLGTYNTSALVYGDHYYTLLDRGFLLCHDARTGKEIYGRKRLSAEASGFTASPWAYNGKVFVMSEDGDTFVVQAGPEYKVLGKNSLNDMSMATPAIVRGSLILRTQQTLYRIARKQG
jgi:outer membrane protein assembly factor BamB